jgi:outer membrane immunogenic protein
MLGIIKVKKLLTSFAAFTALTAAATAADLPRRAAPPIFTPVPVFTWTGFYAGFNAGYGFDASNNGNATVVNLPAASGLFRNAANTAFVPGQVAFSNGSSNDGFVGGGQIGYNYQFTPGSGLVVGIEADAQYVDFGRNRNRFAFATLPAGGFVTPGSLVFNPNGQASLDFFGTVRGRIGYAFDRVLFYGTGGFAYGAGGGRQFGLPNGSRDDFRTGWTAGGGVEYALPTDSFLNFFRSSAVTLKVEGLYVNLENNNRLNGAFAVLPNGNVLNTGLIGRRQDTEFAVVRAGLNYKFGTY